MNNHPDTVRLLLENNADPNRANKKGRTALMLAAGDKGLLNAVLWLEYELEILDRTRKDIQVMTAKIEELENKGGDKAKEKRDYLQARLTQAKHRVQLLENDKTPPQKSDSVPSALAGDEKRAALAQLLLDAGADIHAKDMSGSTALLFAIYQGDKETAELLIGRNADINARNKLGWTPLIIAKATGNSILEAVLTGAGALMEATDQKTVNRLSSSLARFQRKSPEERTLRPKKK